jgi:hypothetical protein
LQQRRTTTTTRWRNQNRNILHHNETKKPSSIIIQQSPSFLSCRQRCYGSFSNDDNDDDDDRPVDNKDDHENYEWDPELKIFLTKKKKRKKKKKKEDTELPEPTYEIHPIPGLALSPHAKRIQITNIPTYLNDMEAALIQEADKYPPITSTNDDDYDSNRYRKLDEDEEFDLMMRFQNQTTTTTTNPEKENHHHNYYDEEDGITTLEDIRNRRPVQKLQDELLFLLALEKVPATMHFITQYLWKQYPHDKIILITELEETARDFFAEFERYVPDADDAAIWYHKHLCNPDRKFILHHFADPHHPSKVLIATRGSFRSDAQIPIANHVIFHDLPWRISHYTNSMDRVQVWDQSKPIYEYWITANTQFDQNKMHVFLQRLMHYQTTMHAKEEAKDHGQNIVHEEDYAVPDIRITWKDILGIDGVEPIPRRIRKIKRILNKKRLQRKKKKRIDPLVSGLSVESETRLTSYRDPEHDQEAWRQYPPEIPIIKRD